MRNFVCTLVVFGLVACGSSESNPGPTPPGNTTDGGERTAGGTADGGAPDAGAVGGMVDGGTPDAGTVGGGTVDGGSVDGGTVDGGISDAGTGDGGATDAGTPDAGIPDGGATDGVILWQRDFPSAARVGSDWDQKVVASEGSVLMRLDPGTGETTASHDFNEDPGAAASTYFQDRLGIAPGTSTVWGTLRSGTDPYAGSSICAFDLNGTKDCVQGALDQVHITPATLSPEGSVGWGVGPFVYYAKVIAPDGTQRTTELWSTNQYDGTHLIGVVREPNGDAVVALHAGSDFEVDGQKMGPSDALFRIDAAGHLVWWRQVPFAWLDFGLTSAGTVVGVGTSAIPFTWGGRSAHGTVLVVAEANGAERFVRSLDESVADSAIVSVLPLGRVAIALNRPNCGGGAVFRYDLAGAETWRWDLASHGCDVSLSSISILPEDVLVGGQVNQASDLGAGILEPGGFVLELGAPR